MWRKWNEIRPRRLELIDVVYKGDALEVNVWILCGILRGQGGEYGEPVYWRPAEELPEGLEFEDAAPGEPYPPIGDTDAVEELIDYHCDTRDHDPVVHAGECVVCKHLKAMREEMGPAEP